MVDRRITKAGKVLCITQGEYESYGIEGIFVVLCDFDPMEKIEAYLVQWPGQRDSGRFRYTEFLSYLLSEGLLIQIDYDTLFLGDYGNHDYVEFIPGYSDRSSRRCTC